ncbi:BTAD domain-containing putative transcriptional regulator [Actinoplanes sp. N902-109]|uniref:AfsR/SARP family transcriptional regulator n=1 Tax=Actinoplanes sp. (strain N902-109) TaxID=649831 RepID=UPI0003294E5F|nr:BTAD domain-containing putative transcriptional regulator [Actinoplanes sp. N902-109]AGL14975.1 SARP family transcriptional regulator [Actinoplanes sp. N902-109]
MEVRLLGPVELSVGDRVWEVGPPQRRHVLAALLADPGRPVSVETLIDRVWDDGPPQARRTLQVHLTHLRRLLERVAASGEPSAQLTRRSGGYLLEIDPDQVDIHRFGSLVAQGRWSEARAQWRGEPLSGLPGRWAARTREVWKQRHLDATVAWAQAELAASKPGEVIGPLRDLAAQHPTAEALAVVLMQALHAAGRSAEALEHYAAVRVHLATELGTDPGAELQAVHQAILRAPMVTGSGPAQLPPDAPGFTGRDAWLSRLDKLLTRPSSAVIIAALSGTAGVGKTALAVHWAHSVAHHFPDGQLYVNLRGFDPSGRVMDPAEAIRGFLDALGVSPSQIPAGADAQIARYRALVAGRRMLVLLDNARDAEQVRPLLPGTTTAVTVVTSRNQLTGLLAAHGAQALDLDVLAPAEARDLLARRLGCDRIAAEPAAVDAIVTACARLPLALSIAAARAQQTGFPLAVLAAELAGAGAAQQLSALDAGDPISDVRAVFSWSYDTLIPPVAQLHRHLGVHHGRDLSITAAASLAGVALPEARRLLTRLVRASLLTERLPGRYAQHDLLRAYATELALTHDSETRRTAASTRLLAHHVHTACAANRLLYPTLAPIAVPLPPVPDDVTPEPLADLDAAMAWLEAEHANLLAALARAVEAGLDTLTWQLAWGLDTFHYRGCHWHDQADSWQAAIAAAERMGDARAEAYAHRRRSEACRMLGRPQDANAHAQHALRLFVAAGDRFGEGGAHLDLAMLMETQGDLPAALDHAERALAAARAGGHERVVARALNTVGWFQAQLGDHRAALAFCREALALNRRLDDLESTAATLDSIGYALHHLGDRTGAVTAYQDSAEIFDELGHRLPAADALLALGDIHRESGDSPAAGAAWRRALRLYEEIDDQDAVAQVRERLDM